MIRINLIPPQYEAAQAKKEQRILVFSFGGIFVILLAIVYFLKSRQAEALETQITSAENELNKYQTLVSQIEQKERDKNSLLTKRNVIKDLNRSRLLYPVLFEDFLPVIPSDVWLTSLQIAEPSGGSMKITMNCNALSNFAVATWLTNLQQSPHFSGIDLGSISYTPSPQGGSTLSFGLSCVYQHKGPYPLAEMN